jgi:cytoskeletal protein RodZ
LTEQQVGTSLRQAREAQSLSLEKVAQETHIRLRYLQALESGELSALPSNAQARGFLRAYAGFLGLDPSAMLSDLEGETGLAGPAAPEAPPPEVRPAPAPQAAEVIFAELGHTLARQRELLGFSLLDVERHTHLRIHYLEALEAGRLDRLPSPVQGRGMLSNYAEFLGLETDPLLLRFAEGLQAQLAARQPQDRRTSVSRLAAPTGLRRLISADLIFGGLLVTGLMAFLLWAAIRISATRAETQASPVADLPVLVAQPTATPSLQPPTATQPAAVGVGEETGAVTELPEAVVPAAGDGPLNLTISVYQRSFLQVIVDGQVAFSGRVLPGSAYAYSGEESIEILTGNAAGLQVIFNDDDLGRLGFYGEVVNLVFSLDGVLTPTPTLTPTGTPTPRTTPTPLPTATPAPTQS